MSTGSVQSPNSFLPFPNKKLWHQMLTLHSPVVKLYKWTKCLWRASWSGVAYQPMCTNHHRNLTRYQPVKRIRQPSTNIHKLHKLDETCNIVSHNISIPSTSFFLQSSDTRSLVRWPHLGNLPSKLTEQRKACPWIFEETDHPGDMLLSAEFGTLETAGPQKSLILGNGHPTFNRKSL